MTRGVARGVARDVARGAARGVARGVVRGVAHGVARGVARGVSRGVARGVARGLARGAWRVVATPPRELRTLSFVFEVAAPPICATAPTRPRRAQVLTKLKVLNYKSRQVLVQKMCKILVQPAASHNCFKADEQHDDHSNTQRTF